MSGITDEDREKMAYLSEAGAPRGGATLDDVAGEDDISPESGKVPTATRERVLNETEFERLLIGASRGSSRQASAYDLETRALILITGRLGLRRGEMAHLSANWVDRQRKMLMIPDYDPCTGGRGGGLCGYCRQAVDQMERNRDDPDRDELKKLYWRPKTEASVRSIPYGSISTRVEFAVEWLCATHDGWPYSSSTVRRRIEEAAENAPGLEREVTPHGLRGTAATFHAGNGVRWQALKTMMGWRENDTPKQYLSIDGAMTRKALGEVYGGGSR